MSIPCEYDTTIDELIKDLEELKKKHGGKTRVSLASPGHYDPLFDGRNCRLKAMLYKGPVEWFKGRVVVGEWSAKWDE